MSAGKRPSCPNPTIFILMMLITFNSGGHTSNPTSSCPTSSCGSIAKIRYPFRLKTDPVSCGHYNAKYFELDCKNNRTVMSPSSSTWYYVQEIIYNNNTIRLVDPGINRENLSSCPLYSNNYYDWHFPIFFSSFIALNAPVAFVHCLSPVNSENYIKGPFCGNRSNIFANFSKFYSYIIVGEILVSDLEESCTVDRVVWVSMKDKSSLASIYDGLAYGLVLRMDACYYKRCGAADPWWSGLGWAFVKLGYSPIALAGRLVIGVPLFAWLLIYKWRRRHLCMDKAIEEFLQGQHNFRPIKYTYSEIMKMTDDFSQKLGEGGYGTVYKGKLRSGSYVAIKMMEQSMTTEEEFISEVGTIGRIHHVNVVQLIGFCVEHSQYALVYEFLPNGSLDRYIFNQQSLDIVALTFEKMYEIALGVAHGISYLHNGCDMQILHFDIKPHNILLDEKFNPKISDFGLARLHPTDESSINLTDARGTMGYMAPEMFYKNLGNVSYKADVYSFGMMLMEMASRRKNMNPFVEETSQMYFPSWVYDQLCAGNDIDVKDATEEERKMVKKIILVALWCIQMRPLNRPPMNKIIEMLEGESEPQMPPKPFVAPNETAARDDGITRTYSVDYINLDLDYY